jgi:hypothetical protein
MLAYAPVLGAPRPRLGQFGGLTDALAKSIVQQAEPATRRVIRDERNRLAEALIGGIPFAAVAAIGAVATYYLVNPEAKAAKFVGYSGSAAILGIGAWWTFSRLTATPSQPSPPSGGVATDVAATAAKLIVDYAEPKIRSIVDEERARLAEAAQATLPFVGAGAIGAAITAFAVKDDKPVLKVVGYSASALIALLGAYMGLEKERSAA